MFIPVRTYSCLLTGTIPVQIHTGIITWSGTGIFMNIQAYSCSWNFRKAGHVELEETNEIELLHRQMSTLSWENENVGILHLL